MNISNRLERCQCLFRNCQGKKHMIFTTRRLQDNCEEQNVELHFVDFTKACKTFSHDGLKNNSNIRLYSHGTTLS